MPEPKRKSDSELTIQQFIEIVGRPLNDESDEKRKPTMPEGRESLPSRDVVLRVIDSLKRV